MRLFNYCVIERSLPDAFVLLIALTVLGCKQSEDQPMGVKTVQGPDSVAAFILQPKPAAKEISFPGELLPFEASHVYAKVPCYIKKVLVDMGDRVVAGQVIAMAEAPEMQAQFAQTLADVQAAASRLSGSRDAYERLVRASKTDGAVAVGDLERQRNQMMADSGMLQAAKARQEAAANLKDYLTIRAPFSGIVTRRFADAGALVGTPQSQPLFIIENNRQLRLRLPVPELYTSATTDGQLISFTADAWPGEKFPAKLSRKSGTIDLSNRTETWEYLAENADGKLKAGMYISAKLTLGRGGESYIVPPTAIATTLERKFIITLHNGRAQWVDVKQGITTADGVEVFGMLNRGDTILARGNDEIKPGTAVMVKIGKE